MGISELRFRIDHNENKDKDHFDKNLFYYIM